MWEWVLKVYSTYDWLLEVGLLIVGAFFVYYIVDWILKLIIPRIQGSNVVWDEAFFKALKNPFKTTIVVGVILLSLRIATQHIKLTFIPIALGKLEILVFTGIFIWFAMNFVANAEKDYVRARIELGKHVDRTSVRAISQVMRILLLFFAVFFAMQAFGVSFSAVLTFGGAGAFAAAFAAKDLLANFFGGLMIFLDRPFSVGDWILSPDKEIEGTVEHIGWRLTRIRTFDKRPLYVPNSLFSTISIQNPSRMTNRRIKAEIGVRYNDATKVKEILLDCEKMLREHEEIDTNLTMFVNLIEFSPAALTFQVYTFTKTTNWVKFQQIQQDVFLKIIEIITSHGAECAFPTQTLHVPNGIKIHAEK